MAMRPRNTTDFVIIMFVIIITGTIFALTMTAIILAFMDKDVKLFFEIILEMTKTLIAALVGFLAGRNVGNGNGAKNGRRPD